MKATILYVSSPPQHQPSSSQIDGSTYCRHVIAHPILPWAASIEGNGRVVVLDYIKNEILTSFTTDDLQHWIISKSASDDDMKNSDTYKEKRVGSRRNMQRNFRLWVKSEYNRESDNCLNKTSLDEMAASSVADLQGNGEKKKNRNSAHIISQNETSLSRVQIGSIKNIRFFDRHALFWDTENKNRSFLKEPNKYFRLPHHLIVQCEYGIFLVNLEFDSKMGPRSVQPIIHENEQSYSKFPPTCMAQAISSNILMIGSFGGTIFWYDIKRDKTIKTVHLEKKKSNYISQLLIVKDRNENQSNQGEKGNPKDALMSTFATRFLALCASGTAYLLEIDIKTKIRDYYQNDEDGYDYDVTVKPCLGRIEGLLSVTDTNNSNSISVNNAIASKVGLNVLSYDADRNFLVGILSGGKMSGVWDLSVNSINESKKNKNKSAPLMKPFLVIKVAGSDSSSGGALGSSTSASIFVVPEMQHPSFPDTVLSNWIANKGTGEIIAVLSTLASQKKNIVTPEIHFTCSLSQFKENLPMKTKITSMAIPRFRNKNIICGTNVGIIVLSIEDDNASKFLCGSRHVSLSDDSASSGVMFIEGSSLFVTTLHSSSYDSSDTLNLQNPVLVYKSPELISFSSEDHNQIRLSPRLLMSPSREFLCMFWHSESRYEILHVPSLLNSQKESGQYPPPVEFGLDVVSFAWVGKEDTFAILHSSVQSNNQLYSAPVKGSSTKQTFSLKRQLKSTISRKNIKDAIPSTSKRQSNGSNATNKFSDNPSEENKRGKVELKILIGVNTDETENLGSIAAAVVTSLGNITIRGDEIPTILFGGPVLCIGVNHSGEDDDEAYFYSTSRSVSLNDENSSSSTDIKASTFLSVGPNLPCPDLLVWSDDGKFCCLCVGTRVAIYLSNPPEFTLLGTTLLAPHEPDPKIESAKFVHNVLYVSSSSSVQVIFFGPITSSDDIVTDIDCFVIATSETSLLPIHVMCNQESSKSAPCLAPQPCPMVFGGSPSILTYLSGNLLVSTPSGIKGIDLSCPILRIGVLIAAGHEDRAQRWFDAVDPQHHEVLAKFLERRNAPALATKLSGLSLESMIDLCIKYTLTSTLENIIEQHGVASIRQIDSIQLSFVDGHSTVECVGAFLLSQGKAELVRRMVSECIVSGEEARKEAFFLASLLLSVDSGDARHLLKRTVRSNKREKNESDSISSSWLIGNYVRDHIF